MNDKTQRIEELCQSPQLKPVGLRQGVKFLKLAFSKQKWNLISYGVFLLVMAGLTPAFTYVWSHYIDTATLNADIKYSLLILSIYIGIKILVEFFDFLYRRFIDKINYDSWRFLDKTINQKAGTIDYEFYEIPEVQAKIDRAWNFSHGSFVEIYQNGVYILKLLFDIAGIFAALFIINWLVAVICLITIIPSFFSNFIKNKIDSLKQLKLAGKYTELNYYRNALLKQDNIKDVYTNNAFGLFSRKYSKVKKELYDSELPIERKITRLNALEYLIRITCIVISLLLISYFVIIGKITYGELAATISLVLMLIFSFSTMLSALSYLLSTLYHIEQYNQLQELPAPQEEAERQVSSLNDIVFSNVSYRYPLTEKYVLDNVSIKIKSGQKIAIVGANGSGKTTFIKLLLGLIAPSQGEISVNSQAIAQIDKAHYWTHYALLFQDFCKYKDTLQYNVGISNSARIDCAPAIYEQLLKANFTKKIALDTVLSKEYGGIELSGGEWQKVAMARALYRDSDVYILDEPTAAIDPLQEVAFYETMNELCGDKTLIFVTHRLGSVLFADQILFFENGKIKEVGSHEELIRKQGKYAQFWFAQANQYESI